MMPLLNGFMLAVSSSLAGSIVAKATVVIALALVGAWLARRSRAAVRHALLAAAFGVLLVLPIASVVAPPLRIAVPQQTALVPFETAIDSLSPGISTGVTAGAMPAIPQPSGFSLAGLFLAGWIAGMTLLLLPMVRGLWQVRLLRRSGLPWRHGQAVVEQLAGEIGIHRLVEVLLHESLPGPMTCGVLRPAIVLPADVRTWDAQDLNRAIVHELEHVRRGDWMWHCLARVVCSAYWFHPLVWISWRQLGLEAERACDDAVLRRSEATAYADQLVVLAQRLSTSARTPHLAMANRSDLSARVGALLNSRQRRGRAGGILVSFVCMIAAVVVIAVSPLTMVATPQEASPEILQTSETAFDVASVRVSDSDRGPTITHFSPDTMTLRKIQLWNCVRLAYGVQNFEISGPDWMQGNPLYDIVAKARGPVPVSQMRLMLRTLLAERFHLTAHREKKELPVIALLVAKGEPKFHQAAASTDDSDPSSDQRRQFIGFDSLAHSQISRDGTDGPFRYTLLNAPMTSLAAVLMTLMSAKPIDTDAPAVIDMTGLQGRFDLEFHGPPHLQGDPHDYVGDYKSILQDELGLTLESRKAPVEVLVVDHVDRTPTEN